MAKPMRVRAKTSYNKPELSEVSGCHFGAAIVKNCSFKCALLSLNEHTLTVNKCGLAGILSCMR